MRFDVLDQSSLSSKDQAKADRVTSFQKKLSLENHSMWFKQQNYWHTVTLKHNSASRKNLVVVYSR